MFAYDTTTGERLWTYQGKSISHVSIAVGSGRIFFIDATMSAEQREAFLAQDKSEFEKLTGKERERAEQRLKNQDLRLAVALDARTGEKAWAKPVDVTDCSEVGIGAGTLSMMVANEHLVLGGANANGHYWKQFLAGEFERRRVVVLSAATGEKIWAKDANYRHRPIVVGHEVIAEPWSYDLYTGEQKMRAHPLTGERDAVEVHPRRVTTAGRSRRRRTCCFPLVLHRLLRPGRRRRHAALRRPPARLLDQLDPGQRAGDGAGGECRLRVPVLDRGDGGVRAAG